MRLPDHIYKAAKPPFAHHAPWQIARLEGNGHLRGPGTAFPDLKGIDDAGSGEQFLRFHREMVRVFKWILANTPGPVYAYRPWEKLPPWLANLFDSANPRYLTTAYSEIDRLVVQGSAGDLGNFIEATRLATGFGSSIHNSAHGTIAAYVRNTFGADNPNLTDAGMNSLSTAPHNEHFWGLHGWIDNTFALWQQRHSEPVDQSPVAPHESGHAHIRMMAASSSAAISPEQEARIFKAIWE